VTTTGDQFGLVAVRQEQVGQRQDRREHPGDVRTRANDVQHRHHSRVAGNAEQAGDPFAAERRVETKSADVQRPAAANRLRRDFRAGELGIRAGSMDKPPVLAAHVDDHRRGGLRGRGERDLIAGDSFGRQRGCDMASQHIVTDASGHAGPQAESRQIDGHIRCAAADRQVNPVRHLQPAGWRHTRNRRADVIRDNDAGAEDVERGGRGWRSESGRFGRQRSDIRDRTARWLRHLVILTRNDLRLRLSAFTWRLQPVERRNMLFVRSLAAGPVKSLAS
jgi:hypothetical protein